MPPVIMVNDEGLGPLTWDDDPMMWTFDAGPVGGRSVRGALLPESRRNPLAGVRLESVRACVRWIRANEPTLRKYLTAEVFDWWQDARSDQEDIAARTAEEFSAQLTLRCIYFFYDGSKAKAAYEMARWIFSVTIGPEGAFEPGIDVIEPGAMRPSWLFREAQEPRAGGRP